MNKGYRFRSPLVCKSWNWAIPIICTKDCTFKTKHPQTVFGVDNLLEAQFQRRYPYLAGGGWVLVPTRRYIEIFSKMPPGRAEKRLTILPHHTPMFADGEALLKRLAGIRKNGRHP